MNNAQLIEAERLAISLSLSAPRYIPEMWPDLFVTSDLRKLFEALRAQYTANGDVSIEAACLSSGVHLSVGVALNEPFFDQVAIHMLKDAWIERKIASAVKDASEQPGYTALVGLQSALDELGRRLESSSAQDTSHAGFVEDVTTSTTTIRTGIDKLDRWFGGFEAGELVIVAARPSTGKTAFLVQLALNVSEFASVDWHSYEMVDRKIRRRFIANTSGIFVSKFKRRDLNPAEITIALHHNDELSKRPLSIYGSADMNIDALVSHIRQSKADVVMIDHLSCIPHTVTGSKNDQVGELSNKLRRAAKATGKVIVLAVQMNRAVEKETRLPMLSDLRDSGEIEQDADMVLFLQQPDRDSDMRDGRRIVRMHIVAAKMREGETGLVTLAFDRPLMRFYDEEQQRLSQSPAQQEANF